MQYRLCGSETALLGYSGNPAYRLPLRCVWRAGLCGRDPEEQTVWVLRHAAKSPDAEVEIKH